MSTIVASSSSHQIIAFWGPSIIDHKTSSLTNQYGVVPLSATQSLGNSLNLVSTTTASHVSKGSNIGPVVGGVLGSFVSIVVALLCIRHRLRRYRIAPSSEEYLANQYPFSFTSEVSSSDSLGPLPFYKLSHISLTHSFDTTLCHSFRRCFLLYIPQYYYHNPNLLSRRRFKQKK